MSPLLRPVSKLLIGMEVFYNIRNNKQLRRTFQIKFLFYPSITYINAVLHHRVVVYL